MKLTALCRGLLVAGCSLWVTNAKKCGSGQDLAADGTLRIGIMRKKNCTKKSTGGDQLVMHYTGVLFKDCQEFDSSRDREPFTFTIGVGEVIKGWDEDFRINDRRFLSPGETEILFRGMGAEAETKATSRAAAKQAAALAADRAARAQAAGAAGPPAGMSASSAGGGSPGDGTYDFGGGGAYGDGGRCFVGGADAGSAGVRPG